MSSTASAPTSKDWTTEIKSFPVVGDYATKLFNDITCSKLFIGVDGMESPTRTLRKLYKTKE
jgi:hypothetical protein